MWTCHCCCNSTKFCQLRMIKLLLFFGIVVYFLTISVNSFVFINTKQRTIIQNNNKNYYFRRFMKMEVTNNKKNHNENINEDDSESKRSCMTTTDGSNNTKTVGTPNEVGESSSSTGSIAAAIEFATLIGKLKTTPRTGWVRKGVPKYESVADHSWRVAALSLLLDQDHHYRHHHINNTTTVKNKKENEMDHSPDSITIADSTPTATTTTTTNTWIDVGRCMQLAVVHDIAECIIGDITPDDNVSSEQKQQLETDAINKLQLLLRQTATTTTTTSDVTVPTTTTTTTQQQGQELDDVIRKESDQTMEKESSILLNLIHEYEERTTVESKLVKELDLLDMLLQANEYEETYQMDLSDFFHTTTVEKFHHPTIIPIIQELHFQHNNRMIQLQQKQQQQNQAQPNGNTISIVDINIPPSFNSKPVQHESLTQSEKDFVEEYSKKSTINVESIEQLIKAYKEWNEKI